MCRVKIILKKDASTLNTWMHVQKKKKVLHKISCKDPQTQLVTYPTGNFFS